MLAQDQCELCDPRDWLNSVKMKPYTRASGDHNVLLLGTRYSRYVPKNRFIRHLAGNIGSMVDSHPSVSGRIPKPDWWFGRQRGEKAGSSSPSSTRPRIVGDDRSYYIGRSLSERDRGKPLSKPILGLRYVNYKTIQRLKFIAHVFRI